VQMTEPKITDQRKCTIDRQGGAVRYGIIEFDHGRSYMLVIYSGGLQCETHLSREQWRSFQEMIADDYLSERD
jgi:hypothetical protein